MDHSGEAGRLRQLAAFICAAALVLTIASIVAGRAFAQGAPIINQIIVEGNQRIEPDTVRSYMLIRPGDRYDPELVDDSLKALFATGLFADVTMRQTADSLIVSVVENPIINRVAFEGNTELEDEELTDEIQLKPRIVYTRARVQSDVQRIIELYRRAGRFAATVEPKVVQLPQNRVDLVFEIAEGPVTKVRRINFVGNRVFSDSTLRDEIATEESRWWNILATEDTYDPDRLAFDREQLRRFYLSKGYADFRVVSAVAELTRDREDFFITFTVEEGEQYEFGEITVESEIKDLDPRGLKAVLSTISGNTYNAELIDTSIESLTFIAGTLGYAFIDIRPQIDRDRENRKINIKYVVEEGPRVYVERIDIVGNVRTLDKVIRREMRLVEGDPFNAALLNRSRQRVRGLGFFGNVEIDEEPGSRPDRTVVTVEVEERSTGELSFGAGFSSTDNAIGDVRITERNLLGRGQFLRVGAQISSRTQQIDLSFTEPYFLDRRLSAGFDLFSRRFDFTDEASFQTRSTGFAIRSGFPITEYLSTSLSYTLRAEEIESVLFGASRFIIAQQGSTVTSAVGYRFGYDRRNDPLRPTSGYQLIWRQDLAGLGGTEKFIRTELDYNYYYPFAPQVTGVLGVSEGYIFGIDQDVRLNDRFFIGGRSFRGFDTAGIGPRDLFTSDALGGNLKVVVSGDLIFPLGLPNEFGILGSIFADVGTLTKIDDSGFFLADEGSIRASVGFGISWESPFGPIRLDFAKAVKKEDFDEDQFFRFDVGTRF